VSDYSLYSTLIIWSSRDPMLQKIRPPCLNICQVHSITALGVVINDKLTAADHVSSTSCSSSLYAMRVLRDHGLPASSLQDVFHATVMACSSMVRPIIIIIIIIMSLIRRLTKRSRDSQQTFAREMTARDSTRSYDDANDMDIALTMWL